MNVALVIAYYEDPSTIRRGGHEKAEKYYKIQKHFLKKIKHNCHIINVFAKEGLSEPILKSKSEKETIIHRPNSGLSFGSYFYVTSLFRDEFDYYIFIEDDYVFVKDNFDELLVNEFREDYTVVWLKNELERAGNVIEFGITSKEVLKKYDYFENVKFAPGGQDGHSMAVHGAHSMVTFCEAWNLPNGPYKKQFKSISPQDNICVYHHYESFEIMNGPFRQPQDGSRLVKNEDIHERLLMVAAQLIDDDFNINFDEIKRAPLTSHQGNGPLTDKHIEFEKIPWKPGK